MLPPPNELFSAHSVWKAVDQLHAFVRAAGMDGNASAARIPWDVVENDHGVFGGPGQDLRDWTDIGVRVRSANGLQLAYFVDFLDERTQVVEVHDRYEPFSTCTRSLMRAGFNC